MAEASYDEPPDNLNPKPWKNEGPLPLFGAAISPFLTKEESEEIRAQLEKACIPNKQVLWSGMPREFAQDWADKHEMQTLTTAMGPLMDIDDPRCPHSHKTANGWSKYVHGASILFAWYIAGGDMVTVLSQPPPQRFNPTGEAYYQTVEEPIIKGKLCNRHVGEISAVHPLVKGAKNFTYGMWPEDQASSWIDIFGKIPWRYKWRRTRLTPAVQGLKAKLFCPSIGEEATTKPSSNKGTQQGNPGKCQKKKSERAGRKQDAQKDLKSSQSRSNKVKQRRKKQKAKTELLETKLVGEAKPSKPKKARAKKNKSGKESQ